MRERCIFFSLEEQRNRRERQNFDVAHTFVVLLKFAKKEERKHQHFFFFSFYFALLS